MAPREPVAASIEYSWMIPSLIRGAAPWGVPDVACLRRYHHAVTKERPHGQPRVRPPPPRTAQPADRRCPLPQLRARAVAPAGPLSLRLRGLLGGGGPPHADAAELRRGVVR